MHGHVILLHSSHSSHKFILEDDDQYNMKIDNQQLVIYLDALNRVWLSFMTCFITVHQTYLDFMTLGVEREVKT